MHKLVSPRLLQAFVAQGLVPDDCSALEIELPAGGVLALHYTVFLRDEHLPKLAAAFAAMAAEMTAAEQRREERIQTENDALLIRARDHLVVTREMNDATLDDCALIRDLMDALKATMLDREGGQ